MTHLTEALAEHFNEPYLAVIEWPWWLYCQRWRRLIRYAHDRKREQEKREEERADADEWATLKRTHQQRWG